MITELCVRIDSEMKKFTAGKGTLRSDRISRISGNNVKSADLSAGLRHNVNLMLQHVSRWDQALRTRLSAFSIPQPAATSMPRRCRKVHGKPPAIRIF